MVDPRRLAYINSSHDWCNVHQSIVSCDVTCINQSSRSVQSAPINRLVRCTVHQSIASCGAKCTNCLVRCKVHQLSRAVQSVPIVSCGAKCTNCLVRSNSSLRITPASTGSCMPLCVCSLSMARSPQCHRMQSQPPAVTTPPPPPTCCYAQVTIGDNSLHNRSFGYTII